jgi:hypothetical protein
MKHNTPYDYLIQRLIPLLDEWHIDHSMWLVEMSSRMRTTGGRCRVNPVFKTVRLQLNEELFARLDDTERWNIISHEAAHGICFAIGKWSDGHGPIWKNIHRKLGGDASRCHDLEVQHKLVRRYVVLDKRTDRFYTLTAQKWKRLQMRMVNLPHYELTGVALCNRNDMTWKWDRLCLPAYREAAVFTKLRRIV